MTQKVLFVDDDPVLLRAIDRNLSLDYEVDTAEGPEQGLELIRTSGPYSVIVVDMRMPKMDGIQLIQRARKVAPESVFLMLTGNQDYETAIQAINQAQVFQFLNKPCSVKDIREAIDKAQVQYEAEKAARNLVQESFVGSIRCMTDIIDLQSNGFLDTTRIADAIKAFAAEVGIPISWEEVVASRLIMMGLGMLPSEDRLILQVNRPVDDEHLRVVQSLCNLSAKMVEKVPRLDRIAKLLRHVPNMQGFLSVSQQDNLNSATLLRITFYWCLMAYKGIAHSTIMQELKQIMPKISDSTIDKLQRLDDHRDGNRTITIAVEDLLPGMVSATSILDEHQQTIVSAGRRLTEPVIEKLLHRAEISGLAYVKIVAGSCAGLLEELPT
ncbi:MAG: response regulator [Planctomycetales bacterium]|nr:response regulator [Planctomycetales bacterium]